MKMDQDEIRITLRMPIRVRDQVTKLAEKSGRSMNAEIVARIAEAEEVADLKSRVVELEIQNQALLEQRDYLADLVDVEGRRQQAGKTDENSIVRQVLEDLESQHQEQDRQAVELIGKQSEMIDRLIESQKTAHAIMRTVHLALKNAAKGDDSILQSLVESIESEDE